MLDGCDHAPGNLHLFVAPTPITRAGYGQGTGPVLLDNLNCGGREARLFDCRANPIGSHNCIHSEDAGVICAPLFIPGPGTNAITLYVAISCQYSIGITMANIELNCYNF